MGWYRLVNIVVLFGEERVNIELLKYKRCKVLEIVIIYVVIIKKEY